MRPLILLAALLAPSLGHAQAAVDESYPDHATHRFCERMTDIALDALRARDRGKPMKLFEEDGADGTRIGNLIVRRIYEEPQISSPKKAQAFGRAFCVEQLQKKQ